MTQGYDADPREPAGQPAGEVVDFSSISNPLGPPEWLRPVVSRAVEALAHEGDADATTLLTALAARFAVGTEEVVVGNGAGELLYAAPRVLQATRAVIPAPACGDYEHAARLAGLNVLSVPLRVEQGFLLDPATFGRQLGRRDVAFIGRPSDPTGRLCDAAALRELARRRPDVTFIVDESLLDFVADAVSLRCERPANVIVVCSMSAFYGMPGLGLGALFAEANVAAAVRHALPPRSVNAIARAVGLAALEDEGYAGQTRAFVRERREELAAGLREVGGLTVFPGEASFFLVRVDRHGLNARIVAERLLREHRIAVRVCDGIAGLDARYCRIAVRDADDNARLCAALAEIIAARPRPTNKKRAAAIMFQGTSSNAGKSVLTAALCRILLQDGLRVAPFKAQNMSLNSFVARDGGEMGRAQAVQAQACRLDPDVRMNPVLLKPSRGRGSQVIIRGRVAGDMDAATYQQHRAQAIEAIHECYDSLATEYDIIVLEGAGSPGEVNLKQTDLVNMRMARYAGAPVLLVGDIDRGGVFAAFVGTMEVLAEWERRLVAGFVVNRFRGDAALLGDAYDYVMRHTGRPVLGTVPYIDALNLPDEDSVDFKDGRYAGEGPAGDAVTIAVIDLPHISNFTDVDPFRIEPDVRLRIARAPRDLDGADAVILPGSKSVANDLAFLRQTGLAARIEQIVAAGEAEVVGICGGFQMLGREIADPHGVESGAGETVAGLGLLPLTTVLAPEKTLVRVKADHGPSGERVFGYEIHHGETALGDLPPLITTRSGRALGAGGADGRTWGTYLHGVFDADLFRRWFLDRLRTRRGLAPLGAIQATFDLEPALDRLAGLVRESLRMDDVYRLITKRTIIG